MFAKTFSSRNLILLFILTLVAACGTSTDSPPAVYKVEYVPGTDMNAPVQGKTTFQLIVTKTSDSSAATGLTPELKMTMHMTPTVSHSTPIDSVKESTTTPGTYDCTVYYLMAGTWEMKVTIEGETTTFNPDVAMRMGTTDTVLAKLYGQSDLISDMTGTSHDKRTYYIFNDGLTFAMGSTSMFNIDLFIAAKDSTKSYPALSSGGATTLHDENNSDWTANPVNVGVSTDTGTCEYQSNTGGHWTFHCMSGITSGMSNTIYVSVAVGKNGVSTETKTTVDGMNNYCTMHATPPTPAM